MLTICLVTLGREEFLDQVLESISECIKYNGVNAVILDNGSPAKVSEKIRDWEKENSLNAIVYRFEQNELRMSRIWAKVQKEMSEWAVFPGDDDVLRSEFIPVFLDMVSKRKDVCAISASMNLIDPEGIDTGTIINPALNERDDLGLSLAKSFHEAPFSWPSLYFKVSQVSDTFDSRFVSDWWVGLQLVLKGNFITTDEISINYRVHNNQESFSASLRRKYFEGGRMLSEFITTGDFRRILLSKNTSLLYSLIKNLKKYPPIYGDQSETSHFYHSLCNEILNSDLDTESKLKLNGMAVFNQGVILRFDELATLLKLENRNHLFANANFIKEECCDTAVQILSGLPRTEWMLDIKVSCECKKVSKRDFIINCKTLEGLDSSKLFDDLALKYLFHLENSGAVPFALSSGEKWILRRIRAIRKYIPRQFLTALKNLRRR
jgi:glycosyltransferase involved in cell wall biosynthesis